MEQITFQYPTWYFLICLLVGAGFAFVLYWKDKTFSESTDRTKKMLFGLAILRFLSGTIISFLLLAPLLRSSFTEEENPVIVFMQDNTESIKTGFRGADSTAYRQEILSFLESVKKKYDLHTYSFTDQLQQGLSWDYNGKITNISRSLKEVFNKYSNQNIGAIILASDGIYNQGNNPVYNLSGITFPVYTVSLGDTIPKKDLKISKAYYNDIVYLGDRFTLGIDIAATNCLGNNTHLSIIKVVPGGESETVHRQQIAIDKEEYANKLDVVLEAKHKGMQHFRISVSPVAEEATLENNYLDIFIDVLDGRNKILLLAHAPHPDISALKQAIEKNKNYEIQIGYADDFKGSIEAFNLVILHQLPTTKYPSPALLAEAKEKNIPLFYVIGTQTSVSLFNQAQNLLNIKGAVSNLNEVQATVNPTFTLFKIPDDIKNKIGKYPPLKAPHGEYSSGRGSALLHQKIGAVTTSYPLVIFDQAGESRLGVLAGEGMWRWRMYDQLQNNNQDAFDGLIGKIVQYLSVKSDKRKFRVGMQKNFFMENEAVILDAELYNDAYELVNEPDVSITITNEEEKDFTYNFSKTADSYTLNAGYLPVGNYSFSASTTFNGQAFNFAGQFSVSPLKTELVHTTADHKSLFQLSHTTGGNMYYPGQLTELAKELLAKEDIRPVLHDTEQTRAFINLRWIFFIILLLLGAEWFVRKYNGAY